MTTATTCPYCGVGCGVLVSDDGAVRGDPDHPANFGRLCSKGAALGETLDLDGRLLQPRIGGRAAKWDTALDLVAARFSEAIRDHGPDSVAFYVSGQMLTEDYYVANKLMKGFIGSANIDTNSRLCMASSVAGHRRAFGGDVVPGTYEDLEQADLIVLVGSNLAWCHPVLHQRIAAACAARPSMRVVNIDPRRTATSDLADTHLSVAPDGDVALFSGLLAHLADTGTIDAEYVRRHVDGFNDAVDAARAVDPSDSGLAPDELGHFYRLWAKTCKVVTIYSQGVNQSGHGTDKVNAILNCHLATGRIGKPGTGPFSVTGQPNAMGGREVGGLANMLAAHLDIENIEHQAAVQKFWNSPTIPTAPGLKAVDLFAACASGRIKALWIMSTNPAVSLPDADGVAAAIDAVPFTVVSEVMAKTDTGNLADVLLPAAGWGEKSGTVTNSERRISRQRPFLPTPGQARPDWRIVCDVAERMGWGHAFDYTGPAAILREYAALTTISHRFGRALDLRGLAGLDDAAYDALLPVQWPVPVGRASGGRFFAKGAFPNPGGKAQMIALYPTAAASGDIGEFLFNTGRIRDQWHTMTRTGKSPRLSKHLGEPFVEIHPTDADQLNVLEAGLITIRGQGKTGVFRALVTDRVRPGQLFAPMHWTRGQAPASVANRMVPPVVDPISGQPALKSGRVTARVLDAAWYGFAVSTKKMTLHSAYAAASRTETGWQAELADTALPESWVGYIAAVFGRDSAEICILRDPAQQHVKAALISGDVIDGLFYAGPAPVAVSRNYVATLIGSRTRALDALAGRPLIGTMDSGATVCACLSVGMNTIRSAIANGACSVDAIGATTGAGTSCGSCRPELAALIAAGTEKLAAE